MGKTIDLSGQRFGRLTVVSASPKPSDSKSRHTFWTCLCDCGNYAVVASDKLKNGNTKSCGCLKLEIATERIKKHEGNKKTHGQSKSRLYCIYQHMKSRCYNPDDQKFKNYGGRGIVVCEEWLNSFEAFRCWAVHNGYSDDLTIDRIDNDGNYCPENCRWASYKVQANNKRNTLKIFYKGELVTLSELSEQTGIAIKTLWYRHSNGWSGEKLTSPLKKKGTKTHED